MKQWCPQYVFLYSYQLNWITLQLTETTNKKRHEHTNMGVQSTWLVQNIIWEVPISRIEKELFKT